MVRLLFDEPLSEALCEALADLYPGSLHIRLLGQGGTADATIWELARTHGCLVVSKDEDFHRLAILRGPPPKFIWIQLENCSTDEVAQLLRRHFGDIVRFNEQRRGAVSWAEVDPRRCLKSRASASSSRCISATTATPFSR